MPMGKYFGRARQSFLFLVVGVFFFFLTFPPAASLDA